MRGARKTPAFQYVILIGAVLMFITTFLDYGALKTTLRIAALTVYAVAVVMLLRWRKQRANDLR